MKFPNLEPVHEIRPISKIHNAEDLIRWNRDSMLRPMMLVSEVLDES